MSAPIDTYGAAFTIRCTWGKPIATDCFVDTTPVLDDRHLLQETLEALGSGDPQVRRQMEIVAHTIHAMELRMRMNPDIHGVYQFRSDAPITREMVDEIIKDYTALDIERLDREARI